MRTTSLTGVVGLPARPNTNLPLARSVSDGSRRASSISSSDSQQSQGQQRVPRLSISSVDGVSVDVSTGVDHGPRSAAGTETGIHSRPRCGAPAQLETHAKAVGLMHEAIVEASMEIAEEVTRVCDVMWPLPSDSPIVAAGMNKRTAEQLEYWLNVRFDYFCAPERLLDSNVTPEVLAAEIIGECCVPCSATLLTEKC